MQRSIVTWNSPIGKQTSRLYVNEQAPLSKATIDYRQFDSFISHKGDDTDIAEEVGDILYENGLNAYLDRWVKWTPSLGQDRSGIKRESRCSC